MPASPPGLLQFSDLLLQQLHPVLQAADVVVGGLEFRLRPCPVNIEDVVGVDRVSRRARGGAACGVGCLS